MAVKVYCDACQKEDAGRVCVDLNVGDPLRLNWSRSTLDLCADCLSKLVRAIGLALPPTVERTSLDDAVTRMRLEKSQR